MLGLPDETKEQLIQTKRLVDSLNAHQTIATIFKPYPATKLYDYCVNRNLFRLPDELGQQGSIYGLGDFSINVSKIPVKILKRIYNYFLIKSIINDLISCIYAGNFRLLFYYFRYRFIAKFKYIFKR